jgi:cytidine deaminase
MKPDANLRAGTNQDRRKLAEQLYDLAENKLDVAYSPYSKIKVAAAVMDERGNVYTGCNVENASYGLTICAERVAITKAVSEGATKIVALGVATNLDGGLAPCGACRQVISEFASEDCQIFFRGSSWSIGELLPDMVTREEVENA